MEEAANWLLKTNGLLLLLRNRKHLAVALRWCARRRQMTPGFADPGRGLKIAEPDGAIFAL
jgi:hypothetical protein